MMSLGDIPQAGTPVIGVMDIAQSQDRETAQQVPSASNVFFNVLPHVRAPKNG